jgi:NADH:ubiquinone oxidoreductase subunit 2 (subunit N)
MSENTLQLIVGWELVGVCSFALIGHWWEEKPNSDAALKAFLTNRVGDVGLLVGVIILFFAAGQTFDIIEINTLANAGDITHTALLVASLCLLAAVMSKSGQFILHTWLPDAMAGPTPVSALIHAATMVVAGVYMVARLYGVFWDGLVIGGSSINLLAVVGGITVLGGACWPSSSDDIKKVLAYSTVSQLGYMVMALGVGAWTAACSTSSPTPSSRPACSSGLGLGRPRRAQLRHEGRHGRHEASSCPRPSGPSSSAPSRSSASSPRRLLVEGRDPRRGQPARRRRLLHGLPGRGLPRCG